MTWKPPTDSFTVEKPVTLAPWVEPSVEPSYRTDEALKRAFGIELAKVATPFEAACNVSGEDTSKALWISFNWITDPLVIASRDIYLKTVQMASPALDREQLAAKVLALTEEKFLNPRTGTMTPAIEAKDRIAGLKLYSDIMGYTGKVEINNSTKTITHNELTIKLVKPDTKEVGKVINQAPNVKSEITNENPSPITLKLVGGLSR